MRELWINNQLVELYPREPIAVTKQVNKLNELKDRQADYSNQFKVPPYTNNLRIFGFPNSPSSNSINPYTKLPCTYIENGTEIISNGVAIVEQWAGGDIEITCYSGIFDFFNLIGDKSLRDLDLSDADHVFNLSNVVAGNTSDKYVYPLIQWGGTDKDDAIVDIRYQMPALPVPWLIEKIVEDTGYNKSGDVFDFDSYNSLVLPVVEDSLIDDQAVLDSYSFKAHTQNPAVITGNYAHLVPLDYYGSGDAFSSTANWYLGYKYTAGNKVTVNIRLRLYVHCTSAGFQVFISKNGYQGGADQFALVGQKYINQPPGFTTVVDLEVENIILNPGEYVQAFIGYSVGTITIYPDGSLFGDPSGYSYFTVTAINTIQLNQNLSLTNLVPDIKQKDLIKDLFYIYGIVPQVNYLTRTIEFRQFKEIAENRSQAGGIIFIKRAIRGRVAVDWSSKLHISSDPRDPYNPKIRFRFDSYAQSNNMKWAQDDDRGEEGNGVLYIDDNTLNIETDLFTTTLAASIQEPNFKGDNTGVNIKRFTLAESTLYSALETYSQGDRVNFNGVVYEALTGTTGVTPGTNPSIWEAIEYQYEKTESAAPRLLMIRNYAGTLTYTDGTNNTSVTNAKIAYFVDPSQGFHLGFDFLIGENYSELQHVLTKTKIVTCYIKLSDAEFKRVDFFKPVWIEYFGDYFYINQLSNYISGRLTQAELVRL